MKKQIISLLAAVLLITGCEHQNQAQPPNKKTENEVQNKTPQKKVEIIDLRKEMDDFYSEWKNTKYKAGGDTKKGIDSSALVQNFFKDRLSINIPRKAYQQSKFGIKIEKKNLTMGDIIIFKRNKEFYAGIYINKDEFLHTSFKGVKIDNLNNKAFKSIYHSARRVF